MDIDFSEFKIYEELAPSTELIPEIEIDLIWKIVPYETSIK